MIKEYAKIPSSMINRVLRHLTHLSTSFWTQFNIPKSIITIIALLVAGSSLYQISQRRFLIGAWLLFSSYLYNISRELYVNNKDFSYTGKLSANHLLLFLQYSCLFVILHQLQLPSSKTKTMIYINMGLILLTNSFTWICQTQSSWKIVSSLCQIPYLQSIIDIFGSGTLVVILSCLFVFISCV